MAADLDETTAGYNELVKKDNGDLVDGKGWNPIGEYSDAFLSDNGKFTGIFNGLGNSISGLVIHRETENYVGLFSYNEGTIKKTVLDTSDVEGDKYVGVLVGANKGNITNVNITGVVDATEYVGGLVGVNYGTVEKSQANVELVCDSEFAGGLIGNNQGEVEDSTSSGYVAGDYKIGGLVGVNSYEGHGLITGCSSDAEVEGALSVGGLVGSNINAEISNSHATGSVDGERNIGGLVGKNKSASISSSYATGNVTADIIEARVYVGGLVGYNINTEILDSYATGDVIGYSACGGLIGNNSNGTLRNSYAVGSVTGYASIGGLIGYTYGEVIEYCYSRGLVSGTGSYIGGLIGRNYNNSTYGISTITNNYYDSDTTQQTDTGKGLPRSTTQMQEGTADSTIEGENMYVDWENTIWDFGTVSEYPKLK